MTDGPRRVTAAFATLAETLTSDFDVVELLHTLMGQCLALLDVDAAGLLLVDARGDLELVASTSESAGFVEMMQLDAGAGPCIASARSGEPVSITDIDAAGAEWTGFRDAALQQGYRSAHAVPLRVRSRVIGAMGLFRSRTGALAETEAELARALADVASVGILHERVLREGAIVTEQLQRALDTRVVIEQAKGVLAALWDLDMDDAFGVLRSHARSNGHPLHAVARGVVDRSLHLRP